MRLLKFSGNRREKGFSSGIAGQLFDGPDTGQGVIPYFSPLKIERDKVLTESLLVQAWGNEGGDDLLMDNRKGFLKSVVYQFLFLLGFQLHDCF